MSGASLLLKGVGGALVFGAACGLGFWYSWRFRGRLRALESLRRALYFLKGEIVYSHAPLPEALERAGNREGRETGALFCGAARAAGLREGESFAAIWERELLQARGGPLGQLLEAEDWEELRRLGSHLGYLDLGMQERTLLLCLEQLDLSAAYLRDHLRERCRLYGSLGVMGGLFLVIVMC